ncbi:hypothetical protein S100390_v1c00620 [Spiroplasma sp. NBRC 100390]|uniref:TMEM164 family acyltransferase n=1 Tax=unclassified Spiroplasma TaxID=2637901 RepID=UPI0008928350|nr:MULTISPECIES: YwaF family protein [unclassified Spiroplasma]AOX43405.1 hypothetical protein STU14_v1c00620 [Spiroplasma sp. TU-14]APE12875.1 hypothetical protein S100390_v1c00620 [Spiroplasma sp. NBRC 100390]
MNFTSYSFGGWKGPWGFFDPLGSQWAQPKGPVTFGIEFGIGLSMVVVLLLIVFLLPKFNAKLAAKNAFRYGLGSYLIFAWLIFWLLKVIYYYKVIPGLMFNDNNILINGLEYGQNNIVEYQGQLYAHFFDTGTVDRLHLPIYKAWVKLRLVSPGVYETISSGSTIRADNWTDAVPLELCKWLNLIYGILLLCPQNNKVTRRLYSYYAPWGVWLPILALVFPPDAYTFGNYYYWAHYGNHALIIAVCWWMHLYGTPSYDKKQILGSLIMFLIYALTAFLFSAVLNENFQYMGKGGWSFGGTNVRDWLGGYPSQIIPLFTLGALGTISGHLMLNACGQWYQVNFNNHTAQLIRTKNNKLGFSKDEWTYRNLLSNQLYQKYRSKKIKK